MQVPNQKQKSVRTHDFAMNPSPDVPRSVFGMDHGLKTAFSFSYLIPILVEEVLPGDTWRCGISVAARTAVPIVPIQDNWHLEFQSFFCPMRLVWSNARKFWGEQDNPGDSINYTIPYSQVPIGGYPVSSLGDYFGLPTIGQMQAGLTTNHNALIPRAYALTYNQWYRDENIQNSVTVSTGDGPDSNALCAAAPLKRGKRFDYINQALPWPQKGNTAATLPLGTSAPVIPTGTGIPTWTEGAVGSGPAHALQMTNASNAISWEGAASTATTSAKWRTTNLVADLTTATAATIAQLRTAITLQQYLEKDARGGTRYIEFVYNHFKVRSPDARLQRVEFIGGGHANILTSAIPQTSATGLTGGTTPAGTLTATGHASGKTGFTYSATEHGWIFTLVSARADITYQQGLRKMWSKSTRYDYPVPLLAGLGEQALLTKELYCDGSSNDDLVFGYVPRFDEYRHIPSRITGIYRSTSAGTIDYWHSAQKFTALPTLNSTYITDDSATVVQRNFTAGAATANQQILADFFFDVSVARALPAYGIPGLTRL